ncbi:MAG: LytTR family transcriptional regulator DNA-binding domain-containing protein [Oscillospiraceae bacterium]|nr:LytTR family transcriptional regulator DNA-binding domain-containing protein [Oscillospiraceae bacterium]
MKYTIEQTTKGEDELILRYQRLNSEVEAVLKFMNAPPKKLIGTKDSTQTVIDFSDVLYIETVDRKTFIYTADDVFRSELTLAQLEEVLNTVNFFRCAKSMIINIDKIATLKSLASNRIDAALCNGEHIIISRTYASEFRKILKGESGDE